MKTCAIIKSGKVVDVIAWADDSEYPTPKGSIMIQFDIDGASPPGIGWGYIDGEFIPPFVDITEDMEDSSEHKIDN